MSKKTIILSKEAEEYFNEVAYSLDYGDGKVASNSQIINHCLEELALFEKYTNESVTGYLANKWPDIFENRKNKKHKKIGFAERFKNSKIFKLKEK